jgi:hypothetical protein
MAGETCDVDDCGRQVQSRGMCKSHAQQMRRWGFTRPFRVQEDPTPAPGMPTCIIPECGKGVFSINLCQRHYWRQRRTGSVNGRRQRALAGICTHDNCGEPGYARDLCKVHYLQLWRGEHPGYTTGRTATGRQTVARIKCKYGITEAQYDALLKAQNGGCAICGAAQYRPGSSHRLAVDHDHSCCPGKRSCGECVRGLLCQGCNFALDAMHDDRARLARAIEYLEDWLSR